MKGVSGNPVGRWGKGQSGNPKGRPRGSKSGGFKTAGLAAALAAPAFGAGMRRAKALLDAASPGLLRMAIGQAFAGDGVAGRFCLARVIGPRRGQPVAFGMPAVATPGDLAAAIAAVTAAVAQGAVTPDEALALARMLAHLPRLFAAIPEPEPEISEERANAARYRLIAGMDRIAAEYRRERGLPSEEEVPDIVDAVRLTLLGGAGAACGPQLPRPDTGSDRDTRPSAGSDIPVAEQQEQHQHHEQQPANAESAAVTIA